MNPQKSSEATRGVFLAFLAGLWVLTSCGGGGSKIIITPPPANNELAVEVNSGPEGNYVNGIFTTVTICVPGTTTCQQIPNVLVDTGSYGLRLLASEVSLSLPQITQSGEVLQECVEYVDGSYTWGAVSSADIQLAGEKASSVPVQVISAPGTGYNVPSACSSGGGTNRGTVQDLGSYGILGIGVFPQDCGEYCVSGVASPNPYYLCSPSTGACENTDVALTSQVQNPVALFKQDNNGVLLTLPSIASGGESTASGSLIFGVGTETNNALGSATVYATDPGGNFATTTFNATIYSETYIDSGSNAFYFLDSATLGGIECADNPGWYCPSSPQSYTVTNTGYNGVGTGSFTFSIASADALFNTGNTAFNDLGGDKPGGFDFGLSFFYGRKVFVGIAGTTAPNGATVPYGYWAF